MRFAFKLTLCTRGQLLPTLTGLSCLVLCPLSSVLRSVGLPSQPAVARQRPELGVVSAGYTQASQAANARFVSTAGQVSRRLRAHCRAMYCRNPLWSLRVSWAARPRPRQQARRQVAQRLTLPRDDSFARSWCSRCSRCSWDGLPHPPKALLRPTIPDKPCCVAPILPSKRLETRLGR